MRELRLCPSKNNQFLRNSEEHTCTQGFAKFRQSAGCASDVLNLCANVDVFLVAFSFLMVLPLGVQKEKENPMLCVFLLS